MFSSLATRTELNMHSFEEPHLREGAGFAPRPAGRLLCVREASAAALRREALSSGRIDKAMHRARYLAVVGLLGGMFGAESWKPLEAQDPARCRDPRSVCEGFDRFRL